MRSNLLPLLYLRLVFSLVASTTAVSSTRLKPSTSPRCRNAAATSSHYVKGGDSIFRIAIMLASSSWYSATRALWPLEIGIIIDVWSRPI